MTHEIAKTCDFCVCAHLLPLRDTTVSFYIIHEAKVYLYTIYEANVNLYTIYEKNIAQVLIAVCTAED